MHPPSVVLTIFASAVGAVAVSNTVYLTTAVLAAAFARFRMKRQNDDSNPDQHLRFVLVVPAHDEEVGLPDTLKSLRSLAYPQDLCEVVVVADNCQDRTAEVAQSAGVTVFERSDADKRGKGYALDWAMQHLLAREDPADVFVIVDADTIVEPDFLSHAAAGITARSDDHGRCALQGRYGVLNVDDSWRTALMAAAFDLFNHVKPLGRDHLGLSASLQGNGMIFTRSVMERARWSGDSITEDVDFGLDLVRNLGLRVGYYPAAKVRAQMPTTGKQATSQRERWERGRYKLVRERALPLVAEGLRMGNVVILDAGLNLLLLPLVELGGFWMLWTSIVLIGVITKLLPNPFAWISAVTACGLGFAAYVFGGLIVAEAPRSVYSALLRAPSYAIWKILVYLRSAGASRRRKNNSPHEWVRTERSPSMTTSSETTSQPQEGLSP